MSGLLSLPDLLKAEHSLSDGVRCGFRRVDTRAKLFLVMVAVTLNVVLLDYRLSLGLMVAGWAGMAVSRAPLRQIAWFVVLPLWAALPVVLGLALGLGRTPLLTLFQFTLYREGLAQGVQAGLRVLADTSLMGLLFLTTPFTDILAALRWFRVPSVVTDTLGFMYRYVFLLWDEFSAMRVSARARGGLLGWRREWRTTGIITAQVFMRAYDRSQRIQQAVRARGGVL
jgi:cobalt/nickel transport system permease protein